MRKKRLLLIDKMSIMHRSFHAYGDLCSKEGVPTGAIFGFIRRLQELVNEYKPDRIIVCGDLSREDLKRRKIYEGYKGNRPETDAQLKSQFSIVDNYLEMCHIPSIAKKGDEADDLIGTIAQAAEEYGYEAYVASGDRDLFQLLVNPNITQIYIGGDGPIPYRTEDVQNKYGGILPKQIVDLKALSGDASDNIPGVNRIGEKTAIKFLLEYGTLENLYEHICEIKGKKKEYLEEGKENAFMSQKLARIDTHVELDLLPLMKLEPYSLCTEEAYNLLVSLNIKSIYKEEDITSLTQSSTKQQLEKHINFPIELTTGNEVQLESCDEDYKIQEKEVLKGQLPFKMIDNNTDISIINSLLYEGHISKEALALILYKLQGEENKEYYSELLSLGTIISDQVNEASEYEFLVEEDQQEEDINSSNELVFKEETDGSSQQNEVKELTQLTLF